MLAACCSSSLELDHGISISLHLDNSRAMPNLPSNNRMIVRRLLGQSQFRAVILHKASFLFLMLLLLFSLAGWGEAYTLLPLPASSKAAARSWGKLRTRLLGSGSKPGSTVLRRDAGGPNTPVKERMILRSASAPSPPTAQVVPPEAEEGGVEMFMDEIGKIDGAMMESLGDIESKATAIDTGLRDRFEEIEKGFKGTLSKAATPATTTTTAPITTTSFVTLPVPELKPEPLQQEDRESVEAAARAAAAVPGAAAASAAAAPDVLLAASSSSSSSPTVPSIVPSTSNSLVSTSGKSKESKTKIQANMMTTAPPPSDDWSDSSSSSSSSAIDYGAMRTGKIVQLWSNGDFSTFEFSKAMMSRWGTKVQSAVSGNKDRAAAAEAALRATSTAEAATYMEGGWARRGQGSAFFRTLEIWKIAVQFLLKELKVRKIKDMEEQKVERRKAAVFAREVLLKLGPTFIKFGQLLSTRIDILPKEYTEELSYLQDNVPGFSGRVAKLIIENEFGQSVEEMFDSFDEEPLAAASLGQVHRARYKGEELAIKIQRQGLKELFDLDLKNLKVLAILLDKFDPKSDGAARDWKSIYEESAKLLYKEIDYENEGRNAERFATDFKDIPWVKVPKIYWDFTSKVVLAMEYCPGIKVSDIEKIEIAGIDRELLAKRSAESYLYQLCRHGFFHCDPHPGNVACDSFMGGRLIYYDFGMMDEFRPEVKRGLVDLIFSVYEGDAKATCDAMESVGILRRGADRVSVEKIARFFLAEFRSTLKSKGKWLNELDKEEQKRQKASRRAQLGADLLSLSTDLPFKFPPTFTFVFRAFTSLDGIGKGLDSKYDLTRLAQPFLKELVELRDGSATISLLKGWQKKLGWRPQDLAAVVQSPRKVSQIEDTLRRAEQGDLKLRVRVLESERAFKRIDIVQSTMVNAVMASMFLNAGIMLSATSTAAAAAAGAGSPSLASRVFVKGLLAAATMFGFKIPINYMKLRKFDRASVELGLVQKA